MSLFRRKPKSEDLNKKLVYSLTKFRVPGWNQLKLLPSVLSRTELYFFRGAFLLLLIGVLVSAGVLIKNHSASSPRFGGVYREGLVGSPRFINPVLAATDADRDLARLFYAGLLTYDNNGELVGDLAERLDIEEGGTALRFHLRQGLTWHDGTPVQAEDVAFTIEMIKNPAWHSPLARSLQNITVEIPELGVVLIKSKAFVAGFPHFFTFGILPKHIWENVDPQDASLAVWNVKPVGAGPFKFASLGKSKDGAVSFYRLARFEGYGRGKPYLSEIVLKFFPDFESAISGLRQQAIDGVSFVPDRLRDSLPQSSVRVYTIPLPYFTGIFFQDRKSEFLKEKAVRKALMYAIDRDSIAALAPSARATVQPFLPGELSPKEGDIPAQDFAQAEATLTGAKWVRTENGWRKNKKDLAITLTVLDDPLSLTVGNAIKKSWEYIGVKVTLAPVPRESFQKEVLQDRQYEALVFSYVGGADPDPYPYWHSSQEEDPGVNLSSIKSRAIDGALERGRATNDPAIRRKAYEDFRAALLEDVPGFVLYNSSYTYAVSKQVKGISTATMYSPSDRFDTIHTWYMRAWWGWK